MFVRRFDPTKTKEPDHGQSTSTDEWIPNKKQKRNHPVTNSSPVHENQETTDDKNVLESTDARPLEPIPQPPRKPKRRRVGPAEDIPSWLASPITIDPELSQPFDSFEIHPRLITNLHKMGLKDAFAVQVEMMNQLINEDNGIGSDICANAATGSGKTLAYTIPMINRICKFRLHRLRGLVIVPTRELAAQVRTVIERVAAGLNIRTALANGSKSFTSEQSQIIGDPKQLGFGGSRLCDILVCTPGRLVDHIAKTPCLTLQHLQFLVMDEADRLLGQAFQDWLRIVLNEIANPKSLEKGSFGAIDPSYLPYPITNGYLTNQRAPRTRKLVFSATLNRDPQKIEMLELRDPKLLLVQHETESKLAGGELNDDVTQYSIPDTLSETFVYIDQDKPLHLICLLQQFKLENVLVFTSSTENVARLAKLLSIMYDQSDKSLDPKMVGFCTAEMTKDERRQTISKFSSGAIQILVCSDLMARGIDLSNILHIVNYDAPKTPRAYVHRVGRTARAGQTGSAWTLIMPNQGRAFAHSMRSLIRSTAPQKLHLSKSILGQYEALYRNALSVLGQQVHEARRTHSKSLHSQ